MVPRILSYGGGLDSFTMLVEAIRRGDQPDLVVFVDVGHESDSADGDPGEWPGTYRHIREVVQPLCVQHGIEFVCIDGDHYPVRDARSLFAWLEARHQIPVAGPNRICTRIAKVERFERWAADRFGVGAELEVWIGFEAGEEARAEKDPNAGGQAATIIRRRNRFPLMEWGMCRCRCEAAVRAAGYPVPRKSACTFCPYATKGDWQTLARELPATFARVVKLEADKPPTAKDGVKLSIMGFRTVKRPDGTKDHRAKLLPMFVQGIYKPKTIPCGVCGAAQRATKATGCGYLEAS